MHWRMQQWLVCGTYGVYVLGTQVGGNGSFGRVAEHCSATSIARSQAEDDDPATRLNSRLLWPCILCQPWLVLTSRGGPNRICPFLTSSPVAHQHSIRHSMLRCWKVKERATPAASLASGLFLTGPDPDRKLKGKMTFQTR